MKFTTAFATCCIVGFASAAAAQAQPRGFVPEVDFTEYLGTIPAYNAPLAIEGDDEGNLYYGTFDGPASQLIAVENPFSEIGSVTAPGTSIRTFTEMASGRGVQGLDITGNGTLFVGGDTGSATAANIWKFDRSNLNPLTFSESFGFNSQVQTDSAKRRHGVAIISDNASGLLAASHFTGIDFFDYDGNLLNSFGGGSNYIREPIYNEQSNIIYPIRNGNGSNNMIDYYYTSSDRTWPDATLINHPGFIEDGAANGAFGNAAQNGYYYVTQHQLITLDGPVTQNLPPKIRVWDIIEDGTSLTLAYSIDLDNEGEPFVGLGDAAVINNRLYVTSTSSDEIYVYGPVNASVGRWEDYELY